MPVLVNTCTEFVPGQLLDVDGTTTGPAGTTERSISLDYLQT